MTISQAQRPLAFQSPLGDDVLVLLSVNWSEKLGRPFDAVVSLIGETGDIDPQDLLRKPVSIRVGDAAETPTYLHGYVSQFALIGFNNGVYEYQATLMPWFGLMRHVGGSQVFQQMTVVEIAKAVIETRGFTGELEDRLTQVYRTRPYCVQYAESDFHFLSRLFEEEGIYYSFEYTDEQHTMVLCDDVSAHEPADGISSLPYHGIDDDSRERCVSQLVLSFEFQHRILHVARLRLSKADAPTSRFGKMLPTRPANGNGTSIPGRYFETDDGQHYARVLSEAASANQQTAASGNVSFSWVASGQLCLR